MERTPRTPFPLGWWSFDLGRHRPRDGTYCLFPFEGPPPVPALDGALGWLDHYAQHAPPHVDG